MKMMYTRGEVEFKKKEREFKEYCQLSKGIERGIEISEAL